MGYKSVHSLMLDLFLIQAACTVISALLHYFYLVVFFTMLAYGVEIAISVIYVFETDSRLKWLLPVAWGTS